MGRTTVVTGWAATLMVACTAGGGGETGMDAGGTTHGATGSGATSTTGEQPTGEPMGTMTTTGGSAGSTSTGEAATTGGATTGEPKVTPVLLGLTLHLENATFDAAYFASLGAFAAAFEAHGGRLTFEPRDQVVMAAAGPPELFDWREYEMRGHSVGSHAGIGGTMPVTLDMFTMQAKMRHDQLAPHVDRLDHISGSCGAVDWVTGVVNAGFTATTAATVLCLYAMDPADRPDPYKNLDCSGPTDPVCHHSYPDTLPARLHPWRALDGAHWLTDDPNGKLVIFPGSGTLPCLEEEAQNPNMLANCTFTQEDIDLALVDLDAAIALVDPDLVNTFYWVWGSWSLAPEEAPVLEAFLLAIDERVAAGTVQWASVGSMLDGYTAWVAAHP